MHQEDPHASLGRPAGASNSQSSLAPEARTAARVDYVSRVAEPLLVNRVAEPLLTALFVREGVPHQNCQIKYPSSDKSDSLVGALLALGFGGAAVGRGPRCSRP